MWFGVYIGTWLSLIAAVGAMGAIALLQSTMEDGKKMPTRTKFVLWLNCIAVVWNLTSFTVRQLDTVELRYEKDIVMQALQMEQEEAQDEGVSD